MSPPIVVAHKLVKWYGPRIAVRDVEGADIIYAHDPDTFKAHKHSPEFYE